MYCRSTILAWQYCCALKSISTLSAPRRDPGRWLGGYSSIGINQGVALAAFDLLARIITPGTAALGGLGALTIEHRVGRTRLAILTAPCTASACDSPCGIKTMLSDKL
jgi:hypothetical protein